MSDTLVITFACDAYQGSTSSPYETAIVAVDGAEAGRRVIAAIHALGSLQVETFTGAWGAAPTVDITVLDDAYADAQHDKNLYILGLSYNGVDQKIAPYELYGVSPQFKPYSYTVPGSAVQPAPPVTPPTPPVTPPAPPVTPPPAPPASYVQPTGFAKYMVGPGQKYPYVTVAMDAGFKDWINASSGADVGQVANIPAPWIQVSGTAPAGYYDGDTGNYSAAKAIPGAWPPWNGQVYGPCIIEGTPGEPPPVIDCDTPDGDTIYYQGGWLNFTLPCGAYLPGVTVTDGEGVTRPVTCLIRGFDIRNFHRPDSQGNWRGLFAEGVFGTVDPANPAVLVIEDCTIEGCDDCFQGGVAGLVVIFIRCHTTNGGLGTYGTTHNIYGGYGAELHFVDSLSDNVTGGHLLKSRNAKTVVTRSRLISNGGTESACLDTPDAGEVILDDVLMVKGPNSQAGWMFHYSGENQDANGEGFWPNSSITVKPGGLVMVAPPDDALAQHPTWGPVIGLGDQSGAGAAQSGAASRQVTITGGEHVSAFGMPPVEIGFPGAVILTAAPTVDATSPVLPIVALNLPSVLA